MVAIAKQSLVTVKKSNLSDIFKKNDTKHARIGVRKSIKTEELPDANGFGLMPMNGGTSIQTGVKHEETTFTVDESPLGSESVMISEDWMNDDMEVKIIGSVSAS